MHNKKIDDMIIDTIGATAQTALERVPVLGFFVSTVDKVKSASLQRRFESWKELVDQRLSEIEAAIFEQLGDNDNFATAFMKATELAAQSNRQKMILLANAVKYVAENDVKEEYLIVFLNCISKYTITHFILLKYFESPIELPQHQGIMTSSPISLFYDSNPNADKAIVDIALKELQRDLLMSSVDGMMSKDGCLASRTTDLGTQFIEFFGIQNLVVEEN